ncbi:MAG: redoxin family protein [Verrucomicrobia bacterium]|nr:redoxin family protein [Verrucomicrobiota bacterium]
MGQIVVLDFWVTGCGPCIRSVPHTNEMMVKYAAKGFVFIGVCAKSGSAKMAANSQGARHQVSRGRWRWRRLSCQ